MLSSSPQATPMIKLSRTRSGPELSTQNAATAKPASEKISELAKME